MAKTRKAIAFDSRVRDAYCDKQSQICINRAFAERVVSMLPAGCPEAAQLTLKIEKNRDRIKVEYTGTEHRSLIS